MAAAAERHALARVRPAERERLHVMRLDLLSRIRSERSGFPCFATVRRRDVCCLAPERARLIVAGAAGHASICPAGADCPSHCPSTLPTTTKPALRAGFTSTATGIRMTYSAPCRRGFRSMVRVR